MIWMWTTFHGVEWARAGKAEDMTCAISPEGRDGIAVRWQRRPFRNSDTLMFDRQTYGINTVLMVEQRYSEALVDLFHAL